MHCLLAALAVLSLWDYPSRQATHQQLRRQFIAAVEAGDAKSMRASCEKGVALLPDDPTWRYNLACSLARDNTQEEKAFDELEKAIDLGYRDADSIGGDADLASLRGSRRFEELLEYARQMKTRPLLFGPMATVDATGAFGQTVTLGEQNLGWDFDLGCFVAKMKLSGSSAGDGDLYMNRDAGHSPLDLAKFPGITSVRLDKVGRERGMDLNGPNILFPYPAFGNSSRAFTGGIYWRSLPRMMMTGDIQQFRRMERFYLSNQLWVFPANADIAPVGTNGDVFASITPYWLTTAGRSYSDMPYLCAALEASRAFAPETKQCIVSRGLLAPTIQTLLRKSLRGVNGEADYLTAAAHPTALPPNGLDVARLTASARALKPKEIPPVVRLEMSLRPPKRPSRFPELTYASSCAWALVLRAEDERREFFIRAKGATEFAFVQTHGSGIDVRIEKLNADVAKVSIDRRGMSPTNRVDILVAGRNPGTGWGAPSYVSFARMDRATPYSDPVLTPAEEPGTR